MFQKKKRIVNKELVEFMRTLPCIAGASDDKPCVGEVCGHHIQSRGAGGDDTPDNLCSCCTKHHSEWHSKGTEHMKMKYKSVKDWFEARDGV